VGLVSLSLRPLVGLLVQTTRTSDPNPFSITIKLATFRYHPHIFITTPTPKNWRLNGACTSTRSLNASPECVVPASRRYAPVVVVPLVTIYILLVTCLASVAWLINHRTSLYQRWGDSVYDNLNTVASFFYSGERMEECIICFIHNPLRLKYFHLLHVSRLYSEAPRSFHLRRVVHHLVAVRRVLVFPSAAGATPAAVQTSALLPPPRGIDPTVRWGLVQVILIQLTHT
jgi:hypothetical protein